MLMEQKELEEETNRLGIGDEMRKNHWRRAELARVKPDSLCKVVQIGNENGPR